MQNVAVSPMAKSLASVATLLTIAAVVWGVAVADTIAFGGDEFGSPCKFGRAEEGSKLRSETSLWPPSSLCVVTDREGEVFKRTSEEWSWVPAAVLALGAASFLLLCVGAVGTVRA